jgi:hypothetical protein
VYPQRRWRRVQTSGRAAAAPTALTVARSARPARRAADVGASQRVRPVPQFETLH